MEKAFQSSVLVFFLLVIPFFVSAQELSADSLNPTESVGISINQSVFSFGADPGKSTDFKITVENISKREQKVSVYAQDFSVEDNNQVQILSGSNELSGMKDWIKTNEKDLLLKAGEKKEIDFSLNIPQEATVGSHYAGIFFQAFPPIDGQNFQKTIVSGRVGAFVLLNVTGEVSGSGKLNKFSSPIVADKKTDFKAEFENVGNIYYIPHGEITIKNLLTRKEKNLEVEKHFVFPGKKYSFDLQWSPESVLGIYRAKAYFVDGNKKVHMAERFIFGKLFFVWPFLLLIIVSFIFRKSILRKK
jgi:hypothetical protein